MNPKNLIFLTLIFLFSSCDNPNQSNAIPTKNNNTMDTSQDKLTSFGNDYTKAWNSQKPENVASFFAEKGALIVNGGEPLTGRKEITEFAKGFMTAFPDLKLSMDSLASTPNGTDYHWSFVGTNTGPGGTGNKVVFSGFERWTFDQDGLIKVSIGTFDEADYSRQVKGEK